MSDPLAPNYKKNVGRLATDRYDFENHVQGNNFRHNANQIDLFPTVVIDSETINTLQQAISKLSTIVSVPVVPDATSSSKGLIQLSGDISGTATSIKVNGLQGYPITTSVPSSGHVLTWNGLAWTPSAPSNTFTPGGDLGGSNVSQQVQKITGSSSVVDVLAEEFTFNNSLSYSFIKQGDTNISNGADFYIAAQSSSSLSYDGGSLYLFPGKGNLSGKVGIYLNKLPLLMDDPPLTYLMLEATQLSTNNRILSLLNSDSLTTAEMGGGTGDMVIYIANAETPPTHGNPADGAILYSLNGKLRTKYADGTHFEIGSIPNPSIWGDEGEQSYTYKATVQTTGTSSISFFSYLVPNNYSVKFDVLIIGKEVSSTDNNSYQTNMTIGYTIDNSGNVVTMGTTTYYDTRSTTPSGWTWADPDISNTSSTVFEVFTGAPSSAVTINWIAIIQMTLLKGL